MNCKVKNIIKARNLVLATIKGKKNNKDFYAFIVTSESNLENIASNGNNVVLGDYSDILYSDFGTKIPQYIHKPMLEVFERKYCT